LRLLDELLLLAELAGRVHLDLEAPARLLPDGLGKPVRSLRRRYRLLVLVREFPCDLGGKGIGRASGEGEQRHGCGKRAKRRHRGSLMNFSEFANDGRDRRSASHLPKD